MVLAAALGFLIIGELVLALASAPNNFDSNHYHLAKIEHWVANGDVGVYATVQTQQIILVPGAEFLLLQLRLLTGTLLARLAAELGPQVVTSIRISGPSGPSWKHGGFSVRGARGPRDTYG